ncbi:MAG: hypothetical protein Q4B19_09090, partial [Clostridia bacterium]|nr:hypothetical protein [Clostridia bacterium]
MEFNLPCDSYCAQGFPFLITFSAFSEKIRKQKKPRRNPTPEELERAAALSNSKKKDFESEGGTILFCVGYFTWHETAPQRYYGDTAQMRWSAG